MGQQRDIGGKLGGLYRSALSFDVLRFDVTLLSLIATRIFSIIARPKNQNCWSNTNNGVNRQQSNKSCINLDNHESLFTYRQTQESEFLVLIKGANHTKSP